MQDKDMIAQIQQEINKIRIVNASEIQVVSLSDSRNLIELLKLARGGLRMEPAILLTSESKLVSFGRQ